MANIHIHLEPGLQWMRMVNRCMYARAVKFCLGPDTRWDADHMAEVVAALLRRQEGFLGVQFLNDYENGEYEWISLWATEKAWNDSYQNVMSHFQSMMPDNVLWQPVVQMFEVYQPKHIQL